MDQKSGKILIVDDNKGALCALELLLQFEFDSVKTISNPGQIHSQLRETEFDVVLLDMNFTAGINTGNEGLFWLNEIKKADPSIEVVMITAYGDIELAVKALKAGAADFTMKPWENEKLVATLRAALKLRQSNREILKLREREKHFNLVWGEEKKMIIGNSPGMKKVMGLIEKVANTDANVLITGENGTGKEVVAREIHRRSGRKDGMMVTVDLGAIPDTLFESELFGHKKGAYTDAREDRPGKFKMAHGGTLFLDEISNLPIALQPKLLTALQNRAIMPVGADQYTMVDIRLISATNYNLEDQVRLGKFREDLLYRINTICIEVPPLRNRGDDIEVLAIYFMKKYAKKYNKPALSFSPQTFRSLDKYPWPGNVRELEHTIEKAVILTETNILVPSDFLLQAPKKEKEGKNWNLGDMEASMIQQALDDQNGNLTAAAEKLGISRQTLYNKLKRYDL